MVLYDVHLCKPVWMAISAGGILVLMQFSRTLHNASFLCWFNMVSITISIWIAVIYMLIEGPDSISPDAHTEIINSNLTVQSFFGAMASFVFAYSGQFMYLELMAEMKRPEVCRLTCGTPSVTHLSLFFFRSFLGLSSPHPTSPLDTSTSSCCQCIG